MSIRALKRLVPFLGPLLVLIFIVLRFYNERLIAWPFQGGLWTGNAFSVDTKSQHPKHLQDSLSITGNISGQSPINNWGAGLLAITGTRSPLSNTTINAGTLQGNASNVTNVTTTARLS